MFLKKINWKKHWWKIALAIFAIVLIFIPRIRSWMNSTLNTITEASSNNQSDSSLESLKKGLQKIATMDGVERARQYEQLYRQETSHMTSAGYRATGAAGMGAVTDTFPYGWSSLETWLAVNPSASVWLTQYTDGGNGRKQIAFNSAENAVLFLRWFINNVRGGRIGHWHSLDEQTATKYEVTLSKISTHLV